MKKITMTLVTIILCLSVNIICYAGDIISPLMLQEDSQVYFGEIKHITDDSLVIMQKKNVKGDFEQNKEYLYQRTDFTTCKDLKIGKTYLCTVPETRKNLMIWEVTSMDTDTLEVLDNHTFAKQIEQYLNEGLFEKAEAERVNKNIPLLQQTSFGKEPDYTIMDGTNNVPLITLRKNIININTDTEK